MAVKVTLERNDNQTHTIEVDKNETILCAAEREGLGLPFGCRRGACASCTGKLIAGTIDYRRPPRALKPKHQQEGYILLCSAEPRSDCHIKVGIDIQNHLHSNPWK
ncbi:MAG: 2Fe-2S iron-sulfur cluster-binding protein [Halobacteriaceae archaeon]